MPAVLKTVAQATRTQASTVKPSSRPAAIPRQVGQAAAILFANAAAAKVALAEATALYVPDVNRASLTAMPSVPSLPSVDISLPSIDASAASDFAAIFADNPVIIGAGVGLIAIPVALSVLLNRAGGSSVKATNVEKTLQALAEDARVVLLDVRNKAEIKAQGSPDLRSVKRSAVLVPFTSLAKGELTVNDEFAAKVATSNKITEESLVIVLDADGSLGKAAASEIEGVEKVYYVEGGAEEWAESGPWKAPGMSLSLPSLSLPNLKNVGASVNELAEDFKQAPTLTKAGLAAGAIAGAGFLLFNEIEVVLELAGLFAAGNFLLKLVFADEREKTFTEIRTIVDEKVAIKEVGADLNKIAKAVLEDTTAEAAAAPAAPAAEPVVAAAAASNGAAAETTAESTKEAREWIENWKAKA